MAFTTVNGNPQHNLFLDRDCPPKIDKVESLVLPGFAGEKTDFVHEYGDRLCFHTGSAVQIYSRDLSVHSLIGSLPPGDAVLFHDGGAWATHDGPVRKYDPRLKPVLEEYVVPHGGPWTTSLGLFIEGPSVAMAYAFCGGPRVWAPELQLNAGHEIPGKGGPGPTAGRSRLAIQAKLSRPGDVESMVQLDGLLFAGGERGLALFKMDGSLKVETLIASGILHLAASTVLKVVGGFCLSDGRWIYREFDPSGKEIFDYSQAGATGPGNVVFGPDGSRYLASEKRIVKLGPDGQRQWSHSLLKGAPKAPRILVFQGGRCAYMDGGDFILLDAAGVEQVRLTLPVKRVVSPPYLDTQGVFWLGLATQKENVVRIHLKP